MSATLRSRLSDIEDQIAALQTERATIISQLSAAAYPVLFLPTDTIAEIFMRYADGYPSTCNPRTLTKVCSLWRTVAISTPGLWTRFDYRSLGKLDNSAHASDVLGMWLSRTGALPLDLSIQLPSPGLPECTNIFRLLADNATRVRNLRLYSPETMEIPGDQLGQLSALTRLSLCGQHQRVLIPKPLDVPHLRHVELVAIELPHWRTCLPSQITTLCLKQQSSVELLRLVELTPNLEALEFIHGDFPSAAAIIGPPRALNRLHTLILGGHLGHQTCAGLVLPALRELRLREDRAANFRVVEDLIHRSGGSLTTMAFSVVDVGNFMDYTMNEMQSYLAQTPALRNLEITCRDITGRTLKKLCKVLQNKQLVPALASLQLLSQRQIPLHPLVQMLTARRDGGALRSLKMNLEPAWSDHAGGVDTEMELYLEELRSLRSGGLEVEISPEVQRLDSSVYS